MENVISKLSQIKNVNVLTSEKKDNMISLNYLSIDRVNRIELKYDANFIIQMINYYFDKSQKTIIYDIDNNKVYSNGVNFMGSIQVADINTALRQIIVSYKAVDASRKPHVH